MLVHICNPRRHTGSSASSIARKKYIGNESRHALDDEAVREPVVLVPRAAGLVDAGDAGLPGCEGGGRDGDERDERDERSAGSVVGVRSWRVGGGGCAWARG